MLRDTPLSSKENASFPSGEPSAGETLGTSDYGLCADHTHDSDIYRTYSGTDTGSMLASLAPQATTSNSYARSVSTNATASNLPGPGRALDNLYQAGGRRLERLINRVVAKKRRVGEAAGSSSVLEPALSDVETTAAAIDALSSTATASNQTGAGRLLGKFYQSSGRELELVLGRIAGRAGYGPGAVERSVDADIGECYNALLEARDVDDRTNQKYDWIKMSGTEDKISKACRKLLRYTQSKTPSTQLRALRSINALVGQSHILRERFHAEQANILLSTLPILLGTRNVAGYFYSDPEYEQLLTASRRALYSVEDNEINGLAKQLSRRLTRRVDWTLVEGWCRLGPSFLAFLCHPEYAFLAARYLESSLKILRYNFGAAGPDTTHLQLALFNIISSVISSNADVNIIFEHSVLETVLEEVFVIAWKCAIEYSRIGREHESLQYEQYALWLEEAASIRGFKIHCEITTESRRVNADGGERFGIRLRSSTYGFSGEASRTFAKPSLSP